MDIFNTIHYVLLAIFIAIVAICVIITIVKTVKKKQSKKPIKANPVIVEGGTRFTPSDEIKSEEGDVKISYVREDIILQPRKVVVVGKKSQVKPGKYTVLSAYENEQKFNIRIGNYVKECEHGSEIVLDEGEEVCPTSSTIILR